MKKSLIICTFFLLGCSYSDRSHWDSGGQARDEFQIQRQEEINEGVKNRLPAATGQPQTESTQPF